LATFIFGLGDDFSIFILEGLSYEFAHKKRMLQAYKTAVLLSATTMLLGVGSLIFAQHPAMRSLGQVTVIGMVSVVIISYTVSPVLFRWMTHYKGAPRRFPIAFASLLRTSITMLVYLLFGLYLWLLGYVLLSCLPINRKRKATYHNHLFKIMRFCARNFLCVKFRVHNPHNETFEKPAVVISNHQSQLDIMYALALTPKMVIVTNQWAWNSPFYSRIIRYADFIPVYQGLESSLDTIRDRIESGYSILIFPEGSRKEEGEMGRFYQGAFYVAEKLNVPVVPLVMRGVGHLLPKGGISLNRTSVHVEIGARYTPNPHLLLRERAKECRAWYQAQYLDLHKRVATPNNYFWLMRQQYALRGQEVLSGFLKRWRATHRFETVLSQLPMEGRVDISNSGYGYDALFIALMRPDLQVYGWESNEEQRRVEASIGMNPKNLHFLVGY
jgi:1-acyl-sn-glycerol-3-phosphate acyltransferase